jgi:hypothetical protein
MSLVSFLEEHLLSCRWKEATGMECPGCGFQSSVIALLKGEYAEALHLYPAIYTLLIMLVFFLVNLKFQFPKGNKILQWMMILNLAIIIISYFIKIL